MVLHAYVVGWAVLSDILRVRHSSGGTQRYSTDSPYIDLSVLSDTPHVRRSSRSTQQYSMRTKYFGALYSVVVVMCTNSDGDDDDA